MKEALLYEKMQDGKIRCRLCSHACRINPGDFGFCRVRQNIKGALYTHNYGKLIACQIDPIEKKPLYHFLPASTSFSIAAAGCNFRCGFCQNWQISQLDAVEAGSGHDTPAQDVIKAAEDRGCKSISYTYSEPTVFFEYALDVCRLAKQKGIRNVFVSNGYLSREAISMIGPYLDAANIDLKFFKDSSYRRFCAGRLEPVLECIRLMKKMGIWIEITTLVIPGVNDTPQELKAIADFVCGLDRNIPWHVSAFHPDYKFSDYTPTPREALQKAYETGRRCGLAYVYTGNLLQGVSDTNCHACARAVIQRDGFQVRSMHLDNGKCAFCKATLPGVFA